MRIFSNFDTNIKAKTVNEYAAQYGSQNVLCFGRSKLYRFLKIFSPFLFLCLLVLGLGYTFYYLLWSEYLVYILIVDSIIFVLFLFPIIGKLIDYKLDFIVVTPDFLVMYNQEGIFNKKVITVNEKSIKTISVERVGLLYSIFNNWDLIFLAEGDVTEHGDIKLKWIPKPEKRRDQIADLMNKN